MKRLCCVLLLTGGCVTVSPESEARPAASPGRCDAGAAQTLVGQPASAQLAAQAQRLSGASTARWLRPGQIVTMEYREGRLNLKLDRNNRVEAITCG